MYRDLIEPKVKFPTLKARISFKTNYILPHLLPQDGRGGGGREDIVHTIDRSNIVRE